jgi:hypothetical protein
MKTQMQLLRWPLLATLAFLTTCSCDLFAQTTTAPRAKADFTIKRIEVRFVNPPAAGGERGAREAAQIPWARFECEFDSTRDWCDDVQVKWYVALTSPRGPVMATGDDTYIYVKKGRRHVAGIFMHPFVMERWTGGSAANAISDVGVEIWWQGRLIIFEDTKKTHKQWWQQLTPQPGLLMRVSESPWSVAAFTEYEWSKYTTSKSSQ